MLSRLVSNSWAQVIHLCQPPSVLGLLAWTITPGPDLHFWTYGVTIISMWKVSLWKPQCVLGAQERAHKLSTDRGFTELALKRRIEFCRGEKGYRSILSRRYCLSEGLAAQRESPWCPGNKLEWLREVVERRWNVKCKCVSMRAAHQTGTRGASEAFLNQKEHEEFYISTDGYSSLGKEFWKSGKWLSNDLWLESNLKKNKLGLGAVAHACNPSTLGGWGRSWNQEIEILLSNMVKPQLY